MRRAGSRYMVPVYSPQRDLLRHISVSAAREMIEDQQAVRISRDGDQLVIQLKAQLTAVRVSGGGCLDPATITKAEVMANAGIYGDSRTRDLPEEEKLKLARYDREVDFIEDAQDKIEHWPVAYDSHAVCISAGRVKQPVPKACREVLPTSFHREGSVGA